MSLAPFRQRVHEMLERDPKKNPLRGKVEVFLIVLILLNALAIVLESMSGLYQTYRLAFLFFEIFTVTIFTIEYVLRLWSITANEDYAHPIWGRLTFAKTPFALVDLFAILPFYLAILLSLPLPFVRVAMILRLFRIFKMGRYFREWEVFVYVYRDKKNELKITLYTIFILLLMSSSIMYFLEHSVQPEKFSSIPATMWWGVITLTTVGYGDVYPITVAGKIFGSLIALLGIGLFALPAGILGSGFIDEVLDKDKKLKRCPHCRKSLIKLPHAHMKR